MFIGLLSHILELQLIRFQVQIYLRVLQYSESHTPAQKFDTSSNEFSIESKWEIGFKSRQPRRIPTIQMVIAIDHAQCTVGENRRFDRDEVVLAIVCVVPCAIICEVAVHIVDWLTRMCVTNP